MTCGILVPLPEIEPMPPALGAQSPNHWTTGVVCLASGYIQINSSSFFLWWCPRILRAPTMVGLASTLRSTAQNAPGVSSQYSSAWRRNSYRLQYSGLENSVDCIVHEVSKSQRTEQLSLFCTNGYHTGLPRESFPILKNSQLVRISKNGSPN